MFPKFYNMTVKQSNKDHEKVEKSWKIMEFEYLKRTNPDPG